MGRGGGEQVGNNTGVSSSVRRPSCCCCCCCFFCYCRYYSDEALLLELLLVVAPVEPALFSHRNAAVVNSSSAVAAVASVAGVLATLSHDTRSEALQAVGATEVHQLEEGSTIRSDSGIPHHIVHLWTDGYRSCRNRQQRRTGG